MALRILSGRATSAGPFALFAAFIVPLWLLGSTACDSDDDSPAEPSGVGGADTPDASVRELPGDGRQQTPEFDIDSRQREPIGPQELTERINEIQNGVARGDSRADAGDPSSADPSSADPSSANPSSGGENSGDLDAGGGTN